MSQITGCRARTSPGSPPIPASPSNRKRPSEPAPPQTRATAVYAFAEERIQDMAAVQLADRQQIQGSRQNTHPGGSRHRMQADVRPRHSREENSFQQTQQQRRPENKIAVSTDSRQNPRKQQPAESVPEPETRNPAIGPANAHIEQRPPRVDGRPDTDKGAERADQRRSRQKIGQRGVDPVPQASNIMAQFVRQQDGQQRQGKGQTRPAGSPDGSRG